LLWTAVLTLFDFSLVKIVLKLPTKVLRKIWDFLTKKFLYRATGAGHRLDLGRTICVEAKSRALATSQRCRLDHRCHLRRSVSRARLNDQRPNSSPDRSSSLRRR